MLNLNDAKKLVRDTRVVPVIIDGNSTKLIVDGKEQRFGMEVTNSTVTMDMLHKAVKRLHSFNCHPKKLEVLLSVYTETDGNEYGDCPEVCVLDKTVTYDVDANCMVIKSAGMPIYENNNGIICRDHEALADG